MVNAVYQMSLFLYKTNPSTDLLLDVLPYLNVYNMAEKKPHFCALIGNMLQLQDKHQEAEKMLQEAKRQFTEIGDQLGAAQCL